jgi:sulfate permease, SulP family
MAVNGSLSKTAGNGSAGARTQVSGLVMALTVVTLLVLTGLFESLPEATLAAVVICAVIELVDFPALAKLYRDTSRELGRAFGVAARPDFIAAVAAMLGVLVFDTLPGLFIGISMSLLLLLYRASRPGGDRAAARGGRAVLRRRRRRRRARARLTAAADGMHAVVLDAETIPFIDVTAARMLDGLAGDLRRRGVRRIALAG